MPCRIYKLDFQEKSRPTFKFFLENLKSNISSVVAVVDFLDWD